MRKEHARARVPESDGRVRERAGADERAHHAAAVQVCAHEVLVQRTVRVGAGDQVEPIQVEPPARVEIGADPGLRGGEERGQRGLDAAVPDHGLEQLERLLEVGGRLERLRRVEAQDRVLIRREAHPARAV